MCVCVCVCVCVSVFFHVFMCASMIKNNCFCFSQEMSVTLENLPEELFEIIQVHIKKREEVANLATSSKTICQKSRSSPKIRSAMSAPEVNVSMAIFNLSLDLLTK